MFIKIKSFKIVSLAKIKMQKISILTYNVFSSDSRIASIDKVYTKIGIMEFLKDLNQ